MRYRKLRIAWSVGWGVACVLLIGLWVRSYRWLDEAIGPTPDGHYITLSSGFGDIEICRRPNTTTLFSKWTSYREQVKFPERMKSRWGSPPRWRWTAVGISTRTPYWLAVVCTAISSLLPWIGGARRFSLRTLLVATTLVAVVLGLIVWSLR